MKKIFYSALVLYLTILLSATGFAQGIYQLWGTTYLGGTDDIGVMFKTDGEGKNVQAIHSFTLTNKGARPFFNQLAEYNGKFYSMTVEGGINSLGVIFEWDPVSNIYTKKYDFEMGNGKFPHGSLTPMGGKFYGMTIYGGSYNLGVIFEWDPATNIYTKKYDFDGGAGSNPYGSLLLHEGKFYGMTYHGGINDLGVIFEWDPVTYDFEKKYDFNVAAGSNPYGDLAFHNGKFYGMTSLGGNGGGVIFEWDPATISYSKKFDFPNGSFVDLVGHSHNGNLVFANGKFYGMTTWGGSSDRGIIFEWEPATNTYATKFDFGGSSSSEPFGANPYGNLLFKDGKFYGMTLYGGNGNGGVIFEWNPVTTIYSKKYDFDGFTGSSPFGSLVLKEGKIYGMTSGGGSSDIGVIFEWDPAGNGVYTKKINFNAADNGRSPEGLIYQGGKLYGAALGGSNGLGVMFEWNFDLNKFIKKHDFNPVPGEGRNPSRDLTFCNGKFYGLCNYLSGVPAFLNRHIFEWDPVDNVFQYYSIPSNDQLEGNMVESSGKLYGMLKRQGSGGVIFEWDTATKLYNKLYDFINANEGNYPVGGIVESAGKLYGMTNRGGANNAGVIFEWDISAKTYTKRHDFEFLNGVRPGPLGKLVINDGKFYGITFSGGSNGQGFIFEWDPVSFVYLKKYDFGPIPFGKANGNPVFNNGKMYGTTANGGSNNYGGIFEWDPVTNIYSIKSEFTGNNGRNPGSQNYFSVIQMTVARGVPNSCMNYPPVVVDNGNTNSWVPIIDDNGLAVAEIKANGNNLGIVTATVFINNNPVREDGLRQLYLDRNITITPQFQPSSPVDIRLYISGTEFETIKNATNSIGSPSDIETVNELGIFKNDDDCEGTVISTANLVSTTASAWGTDYVLSARVTKFSTFYFAGKANAALPLTLLEFNGLLQNNNALLNWKTEDEINTLEFVIERSIDGNQYKAVGTVAAANRAGRHEYNFTDLTINTLGARIVYYRLKQKDMDGQFVYSKILTLSLANENMIVKLFPNPVNKELYLSISSPQRENIKLKISDASGRTISQQTKQLTTGSNSLTIDVNKIATGVYFLSIQGNGINKWMQFVKQ